MKSTIEEIKQKHNIQSVYYGSGYPIETPCIIAISKDAWSGEGVGYNVWVYPNGQGYGKEKIYYSI